MTTHGCTLTTAPQSWQILPRERDGFATVALGGTWAPLPLAAGQDEAQLPESVVVVRVVEEATGTAPSPELDWHPVPTSPRGTWRHEIRIPTGGLFRIETGVQRGPVEWAARGDIVHHVGVGDLWVVAGQSNAAGYGRGPVEDPVELGVHVLRNDETWALATHPLNDTTGNRHPNIEDANPGHSPFLSFGRALRRSLGCPIGLVQTARGATGMDSWNPAVTPGAPLYENLLNCVAAAGGHVAGVVWYQGEGEACVPAAAPRYLEWLTQLIDSLRADLAQPALPVVVAQINRFVTEPPDADMDRSWTVVRGAQWSITQHRDATAVVGTLDLPLSDLIHLSPVANVVLGQRLAEAAARLTQGAGGTGSFPTATSARSDGDHTVAVSFTGVRGRLHWDATPVDDFVVEDADGPVTIDAYRLVGPQDVELSLARSLAGGARIHGAYGRDPTIRMYDTGTNRPALGFYDLAVESEQLR